MTLSADPPGSLAVRADHPTVDVTTYLTVWLVLLFGMIARLVVGPLGAVGTPALLVAMVGTAWWAASRSIRGLSDPAHPQPLRTALFLWGWYTLVSYVVASTRSLTPLESTGALRALLTTLTLTGLALLVLDGVADRQRLQVLVRRLVGAATFMAVHGIVQFLTRESFVFGFPGLTWNHEIGMLSARSRFPRPSSMALHPIEFSVVLAALLPLAIHFAMTAEPGRPKRRATIAAVLIGLAVPLSISRSGIVVLVVAMLVVGSAWNGRQRLNGLLTTIIAVPVLWLGIPGLVGTLRGMFTGTATDPSIQARIERIPRVMELIRERPWFGRGVGTYSVDDYFLVDNEVYVSTIELGLVGMGVLLVLLVLAVMTALWTKHIPALTDAEAGMARAAAAGVAGIAVSLSTFDAFHYHILTGVLFLLIGVIGALYRLGRTSPHAP